MKYLMCGILTSLLSFPAFAVFENAGFDDNCYLDSNYPVHSTAWTFWDAVLTPVAYSRTWATGPTGTIPLYLWWDLGDYPTLESFFTIINNGPPWGPPAAGQYNLSGDTTAYGIFEDPPGSGEYSWIQNPNGDNCWAVITIN